jgi:hypothetical protein
LSGPKRSPGVVFLFGAGASFAVGEGGGWISPATPPLTNGPGGLYDCLAAEFPDEWGPKSPLVAYADEFRLDFEDAFVRRVQQRGGRETWLVQSSLTLLEALVPLARFFAKYRLRRGGQDLYSKLVAGVADAGAIDSTMFGTLNYDCLLEQAVVRQGFDPDWLIDDARSRLQARDAPDPEPDSARVAKLHGSCHFLADVDRRFQAMAASPGTVVEVNMRPVWPPKNAIRELSRRYGESQCFPTMSQISRDKDSLLSPGKMTQIRLIWREAVMSAALVMIIGVRPLAHDGHVWEPLQETAAHRCYIGATDHFADWSRAAPGMWKHLAETWTDVDAVLEEVRRVGVGGV